MMMLRIREFRWEDTFMVLGIINEAAKAYGRVLKPLVYHEPQMTLDEFFVKLIE